MSPEHATVLIAEDDPWIVDDMEHWLRKYGYEVVWKAATLEEAKAMLFQIPLLVKQYGEGKIVVILGGSLGPLRDADDPDNDSQVLLRFLRDQGLGHIRTVGCSGLSVPGTTVEVGKRNGPVELAQAITDLP